MPVVTTLHTVLREPSSQQRLVMEELIKRSDRVVVMARKGAELLREHPRPDTREIRASVWKQTLPLVSEYPILGCGLGGFESVFPKHQSVANGYAVEFAHNDYLQYLVELGIGGFSLLAVIISILFWQTARNTLCATDPDRRLILLASTAAFSGILLHSFVDFNMYIPANMMTFSWIAGIASAWLSGSARIPFVAGLDRYLPASLGKLHPRTATPWSAPGAGSGEPGGGGLAHGRLER